MAGKGSLGGRAAPPAAAAVLGHDLGLFGPGGPFESFPGPVLVIGYTRTVVTGNAEAEPLAEALRLSRAPELMEAIGSALEGVPAQITFTLPEPLDEREQEPESEPPVYALDILPWANGAAALLLGRDVTLEQVQREALRRELARCRHHEAVSGRLLRLLRGLVAPRDWPSMLLASLPELLELSGLRLLQKEEGEFLELAGSGQRPDARGLRLLARLAAAAPDQSCWQEEEGERDFCCLLPLLYRKQVTGALFCRRPEEAGGFDAAELAFLAALAAELARALARSGGYRPAGLGPA